MAQNHLKVGVCQLSLTANEMLVFMTFQRLISELAWRSPSKVYEMLWPGLNLKNLELYGVATFDSSAEYE